MRRSVNSWRWPILRREFLRRRFLNAMILPPRPCSSTCAATVAPLTVGVPSLTLSPPTTRTSPNSTISPGSPLILSTLSTSSVATRYCLPPVLKTANIFFASCSNSRCSDPEVRIGFFQSILLIVSGEMPDLRRAHKHASRRSYDGPVTPCQEMGKAADWERLTEFALAHSLAGTPFSVSRHFTLVTLRSLNFQ